MHIIINYKEKNQDKKKFTLSSFEVSELRDLLIKKINESDNLEAIILKDILLGELYISETKMYEENYMKEIINLLS